MALTQVSDLVVPEIFTPAIQQLTEEKSRLIQAGVLVTNDILNERMIGGGLTFNVPAMKDLDNTQANISRDDAADVQTLAAGAGTTLAAQNDARPLKTSAVTEIAIRMSRNQSWSSADLAGALSKPDALAAISTRVSDYWTRELQRGFVAVINGLIADNAAAPTGTDTHTIDDLVNDLSALNGGVFLDGVTNFTAEAFIDAAVTMGDSMEDLSILMVHSIVKARMQKNNLIDFIPDARGEVLIPTFQGHQVVVDDGMPNVTGVFDSWIFGNGAVGLGVGAAKVPTETHRQALAGNGGGQEVLTNRVEWSLHPTGHAYIQAAPSSGGPTDAEFATAANWSRVYSERKQIKFARLVTREF